jgi:uncharacterized protein YjbI with pentapeptide repeats
MSISFPKCQTIGSNAFFYCYDLTSAIFPECSLISSKAFVNCSALSSISFPQCSLIGASAFAHCINLNMVSFPLCQSINAAAFTGCTNLTSIYLANSSICTLYNSVVFSNTNIGSDKGSIFVPASLVASYQKATNWVYFKNRIFALEDAEI